LNPKPIFICGPTASGKSALAMRIARERNGEVVNADAFQLYRGLRVLTAAPSEEEMQDIPHHLFGVIDYAEPMDAGRYLAMASPVIREISQRDKTPVVVGGSGLYLKFLTHGPSPLPEGDARLRSELDAAPLEELAAKLRELDPLEAGRTNLLNRRYVSRALEICLLTGGKASDLRDRWEQRSREVSPHLQGILIRRDRIVLHQRISTRTRSMLDHGAPEEVASMVGSCPTASKAIGFRQIRAMLDGMIDRARCEELINAATRQYAKRQETWFRREPWLAPVAG
jgi:tRNA dimethylallyltransferase